MKKALIFGVSGQDGAYLAKLLLSKGYTVYGTSRDAQISSFRNLEYLGIQQQVELESAALNDFRSVLQVLKKTQPDEVYNLAGQTSMGLSFEQPVERLRMYCGGDAEYFGGDSVYDYASATGESYKLAESITSRRGYASEIALRLVGLDWWECVVSDRGLRRPTDLAVSRGNSAKAMTRLGWVAKHKIADIVRLMIEARKDR